MVVFYSKLLDYQRVSFEHHRMSHASLGALDRSLASSQNEFQNGL